MVMCPPFGYMLEQNPYNRSTETMTNPLDEVHERAYEERQKAPVMNDPTVATPGTYDEVKDNVREGLEAELEARFEPETQRAESSEDSAWNPTATRSTIDEHGSEQDPVGGPAGEDIDTSEDGESGDVEGVDSAYDPVTTTNDIRLDEPEGEDVDTEGATPQEDVDDVYDSLDNEEDDETDLDVAVDNRDQVDDALGYGGLSDEDDDLDGMTKAELREEAERRGVEVNGGMNKQELLEALRA